jgi:hypothetical protein
VQRQDGGRSKGGILEVGENPPGNRLGDPRNVDPFDPRQVPQQRLLLSAAVFSVLDPLHDFQDRFLAVAYEKGVEELRHGRRVEGAHASPQDDGGALPALLAMKRNSGEVEHGEHVRVGQFVAQGEPENVEIACGTSGFERGQSRSRGAQVLLHVSPGGEYPLAERFPPGIEKFVEEENAQVRHPDFVDIRESEENTGLRFSPRKKRGPDFCAAVARRFFNIRRNISHFLFCVSNKVLKNQLVQVTLCGWLSCIGHFRNASLMEPGCGIFVPPG